MRLFAIVTMVLSLSAPAWARETPPAPKPPPRQCIDAAGHQAVCGSDPSAFHECRAADPFGACPLDPKCFTAEGMQVRCVRPVTALPAPRP